MVQHFLDASLAKRFCFHSFFFLRNLLNLIKSKFKFSASNPSALSSSLSSLDGMLVFDAKPLFFLSISYSSAILVRSISYSLNFPNNSACVIVVRSFNSEVVVTFGYQVLLRDFSTLTLISSSSKVFPRPLRWF